jgi:alpha,alpha-trehalase
MMLFKLLDYEGGRHNDFVLKDGLEMAKREYEFWDMYRRVHVKGRDGNAYLLNYYHVHTDFPRPESFAEDILTYEHQNEFSKEKIFTNLKSAAESGWDFSSRWLRDEGDLATIEASSQVPVDLNAILYRNEIIMHTLYSRKMMKEEADFYLEKSKARAVAINAVLWNEEDGVWQDYNIEGNRYLSKRFYFSNIMPMIYGIKPVGGLTYYDVIRRYSKELFGYPGGIPASGNGKIDTKQQWDFPNAWAPHQHMMVEFLVGIKEDEMALHVARSFFNSVYAGYEASRAFFEKYDCLTPGKEGGGGEYVPQEGFGWTNGTILSFILRYGDKLMEDIPHEESYANILKMLEDRVRGPKGSRPSAPKNLDLVPRGKRVPIDAA